MSEQTLKVRAKHQIVHDGQVLKPGTVFSADATLANSFLKAGAVEVVAGDPPAETEVNLKTKAADDELAAADTELGQAQRRDAAARTADATARNNPKGFPSAASVK